MSLTDAMLLECSAATWSGAPDRCRWCDATLTGRRRRWCSEECTDSYGNNHWWGWARIERMRLDSWTCQQCGLVGWNEIPPYVLRRDSGDGAIGGHEMPTSLDDWAVHLGLLEPERPHGWRHDDSYWERHKRRRAAYEQLPASIRALREVEHEGWRRLNREQERRSPWRPGRHELEVDHVVPILGRHSESGCHHHLEGLRTLCRRCHRQKTRDDFGWQPTPAPKPPPPPQLRLFDDRETPCVR